jgi:hypothetical protein
LFWENLKRDYKKILESANKYFSKKKRTELFQSDIFKRRAGRFRKKNDNFGYKKANNSFHYRVLYKLRQDLIWSLGN